MLRVQIGFGLDDGGIDAVFWTAALSRKIPKGLVYGVVASAQGC